MFTYKAVQAAAFGLIVKRIRRSALPPVASRLVAVPGRPGRYYAGYDFGPRMIEIEFALAAPSRAVLGQRLRDLASWLRPGVPGALELDDEQGRYYNAVIDGATDIEQLRVVGDGTVTFICPDPLAYSSTEQQQLISGTSLITLSCTAPVYPIVTVQFAALATEFQIENAAGDFVRVERAFSIGDVLRIDFGTGKVQVNDLVAMAGLDIASEFFALEPSTNYLTVSVPATVAWRERWL